ncbi:hypothetical protein B0T21DRAFT_397105 [Apiosordaria backusii]|uniref:Uncharacterized protein n=1 Tax=Apiosordaria backusii TaxID=314023 RepID=A0AA40DKJ5_9PEZI|nr:hypothetical protein B0T21DRAFT_397105 [Apiosordaria backusii]
MHGIPRSIFFRRWLDAHVEWDSAGFEPGDGFDMFQSSLNALPDLMDDLPQSSAQQEYARSEQSVSDELRSASKRHSHRKSLHHWQASSSYPDVFRGDVRGQVQTVGYLLTSRPRSLPGPEAAVSDKAHVRFFGWARWATGSLGGAFQFSGRPGYCAAGPSQNLIDSSMVSLGWGSYVLAAAGNDQQTWE